MLIDFITFFPWKSKRKKFALVQLDYRHNNRRKLRNIKMVEINNLSIIIHQKIWLLLLTVYRINYFCNTEYFWVTCISSEQEISEISNISGVLEITGRCGISSKQDISEKSDISGIRQMFGVSIKYFWRKRNFKETYFWDMEHFWRTRYFCSAWYF